MRHSLPTCMAVSVAIQVPMTPVAWKMPPACVRACLGKISATSAAATAHSPPTPMATRKRNTPTCQSSVAKYVRPEKIE